MASKPPRDSELEAILEKVRQVRSFDFRSYKRATLQRRIERRMAATRCQTRTAYLALLDRDANEVNTLVSSMLIKLTTFFRDPEVWTSLEKVVREMTLKRQPDQELRIWSAGCATGEEAYSIAILAAEALGPGMPGAELKVFGTDVDEAAIAFARRGVYTPQQLEGCSKERLARWFVPSGGGYAVRKEIRRAVVFGVNNLVSDAPVSRIDLILCRNVFIYLDAELQKRSLARFHFALRHDGVLALGRSELIPFAAKLFEPVELTRRIYRKDGRQELSWAPQERGISSSEPTGTGRPPLDAQSPRDAQRALLREVLDSQPCPLIATDNEGTVIVFNQAAAHLWGRTEAEVAGKRLAALALPGLSQDLLVEQSARVKAGRSAREVGDGTLKVPGTDPVVIRTLVVPLRSLSAENAGLLYVAHDVTALRSLEQHLQQANEELNTANLRLQSSNEEMRASNEELETTNEELQSANEELQTTNEELQSTNEELETTNEELQSTNAELDATNRELAHRTQEMDALSFSQHAIIRALSEGVMVLDANGYITAWNLAAERLLGLTERETVGQVLWTLRIPALNRALLNRVRKHLTANRTLRQEDVSYQLPHGGRGRATLVATPLIMDSQVLGAIILLEDTTRLSTLAQKNREMKERMKA
ncbi:CheR family methyltransferase [Stigmatella aurantiaca]|uniref:protein-glutamate O-methyltransferase n=1 Tax=Stigmatella aurantiaca (strain DW4/3-1) TaxID=378806 RepID=Q08VW5_STIAD|nr:CheR family methyltransferase [Stigmatella aurantiaca]ADO75317.1 Methylase of chemotaxis methyl-accepting protein, CheR-type [Stigmatella aurantiaca DW4/3-1]EAU64634.1 CheB methylesterase:MCP methyltransferase, CheR-type [Stigmatella aurantiaca DW4/3-1]